MTPKEKARKLVDKYIYPTLTLVGEVDWVEDTDSAKQCALIAVDEMTSQMLSLMIVFNEDRSEFEAIELDYLNRVKQEIEKL